MLAGIPFGGEEGERGGGGGFSWLQGGELFRGGWDMRGCLLELNRLAIKLAIVIRKLKWKAVQNSINRHRIAIINYLLNKKTTKTRTGKTPNKTKKVKLSGVLAATKKSFMAFMLLIFSFTLMIL